MILKKKVLAAVTLLLVIMTAMPAFSEVRLFVTKNTVKLYDPVLKTHSVLNDFRSSGWKTHNNLAVVWNDREVLAYDIRSHQWIPLPGFAARSALLSDELAVVWQDNGVAVYDAAGPQWIVGPETVEPIKTALLSRKIAVAMTSFEFMVYDSVLRRWETASMESVETAFDGGIGDNLAVCWDANEVCVYDMTMHRWQVRSIPGIQATIVLEREARVFTADSIYTYDAMKHRWFEKVR